MPPLVSVIIPTYNRAYILPVAIESVLNQTYPNIELLLVDDGSKDNTPYLASKYKLKYIRLPKNFGPSFARNRGIEHSKGTYIAFLDSDDAFVKNKIETQIEFLESHPQYHLVQSDEIWFKGTKKINPKKYHKKASGYFLDRAVKLCVVSISTVLMKKEIFKKVGLFDVDFPVCEDYEFWLRVALFYPIALIKKPLVIKSGGREDQLSARKGLDFYRVKALLKIYKLYSFLLKPEEKLLILGEAKRKCDIFLKGAFKHGNLEKIFELNNIIKNLENFLPYLQPK
ncbi:MAG: glycosyltransferase family 2 protein [Caldimicrobium sp.]